MPTVELSEQVIDFVRTRAPDPRRRLRLALRGLEKERGDIRALEGPLKPYHRLRVGPYRIIFAYERVSRRRTVIRCIYADRRDLVYDIFQTILQSRLLEPQD